MNDNLPDDSSPISSQESNNNPSLDDAQYEKLIAELAQQIKEANSILDILKPLCGNGEIYKSLFEEIYKKINEAHKQITSSKAANTKFANELTTQKAKIEQFIVDVNSQIQEARTVLTSIKTTQEKAKKRLEAIESLKETAQSSKKEIIAFKNTTKNLFKAINGFKKDSETILSKLKEEKIESKRIVEFLSNLEKIASKNSTELQKIFEKGKTHLEKIEVQSSKIDNYEKIASTKSNQIVDFFDRLLNGNIKGKKPIKEEINDILARIKSNQERIDSQLNNAAANRLCIAFKEKEDLIRDDLKKWKKAIHWQVIIIVVLGLIFLLGMPILEGFFSIEITVEPWQYLSIVSPIALLLGFSMLEHARLKKILDEYTFKYVAAFSMPAYFELIDERDQIRAVDYLVETINGIYENPNEKINNSSKDNVLDYVLSTIKALFSKSGDRVIENTLDLKKQIETEESNLKSNNDN